MAALRRDVSRDPIGMTPPGLAMSVLASDESYSTPRGRIAEPAELVHWLRDARARTLEVASGLTPEQMIGPHRATVNPILWALGHVAFFQEFWAWRHHLGQAPLNPDADRVYDSFEVEHVARWQIP